MRKGMFGGGIRRGAFSTTFTDFKIAPSTPLPSLGGSFVGPNVGITFNFVSNAASYAGRTSTANTGYAAGWDIEGKHINGINPGTVALSGNKIVVFNISPAENLTSLDVSNNTLTGVLPDISRLVFLTTLKVYGNSLSGPFPDLSACKSMTICLAYTGNAFSGSLPNLPASMVDFEIDGTGLTGNIPTLSGSTALNTYSAVSARLTGVVGGFAVPASLTIAYFQNNLLTQAAVDAILAAFVAAGAVGAYVLNIGGTGNATPSAAGLTNKATLQGRGWTVTTN
jgi:hypothetical protein